MNLNLTYTELIKIRCSGKPEFLGVMGVDIDINQFELPPQQISDFHWNLTSN